MPSGTSNVPVEHNKCTEHLLLRELDARRLLADQRAVERQRGGGGGGGLERDEAGAAAAACLRVQRHLDRGRPAAREELRGDKWQVSDRW